MEYSTEIVNISKIEDGFFIGDKLCASNIDVIIQFKISHIINTSGIQILNQFESLGVKYFTLNWQENPNQTLFDMKDEIQNKIISFIDESLTKGEGLLVHSVKGTNRALIIVVIYFMKKYSWSLKKCLELLEIKVKNGKIKKYFLKQLENYEKRIKRKMSKEWYNLSCIKSEEEMMVRNTYLNSLLKIQKKNNMHKTGNIKNYQYNYYKKKYNCKQHVSWGNINYDNKNDLLLKKNIKDIDSHMRLKPKKKCIKEEKLLKEDDENENTNNYANTNIKQYISNNIVNDNTDITEKNNMKNLINLGLNMKIVDKINQISNNFNNLNMPKQRPNSAEQKIQKNNINKNNNNTNNKRYDFDKLSNYFDKLEKKEKENIVQNKNYKKLILKNPNQYNKGFKQNNIDNSKRKRYSSYDKNNNKKDIININRQYIYPDKIINNSININMINYITNNSTQQMPSFNKNNFFNKMDDSFNINNNIYEPYNLYNSEEGFQMNQHQNFNKIKNKIRQRNIENKMNNSAINFYNFNSMKNKEGLNNNYYNVMGQSFNINSNKDNNNNKKVSIFLRNNNKKQNNIDINNHSFIYKVNNIDMSFNKPNPKNLKRSSTPNNLLPKRNYQHNPNVNKEKRNQINYLNYSNMKLDESNIINNNVNDISFNNRSFILNQKNTNNQCKYISILKFNLFKYSFRIFRIN